MHVLIFLILVEATELTISLVVIYANKNKNAKSFL